MTTYPLMATEHYAYDQATLPPIPESWEDSSWRNDSCPSFFIEDAKLTVHIAEADPAARELDGERFHVMDVSDESGTPVLSTDNWQAVLNLVAEAACPRVNGSHRDTGRGVCAHCGKVL